VIELCQPVAAARVRIAIRDTGPGIPATMELFRLFDTTKPGGLELGLSITRQIVLAHDEDLAFERRTPRGTVVDVDLPVGARVRPSLQPGDWIDGARRTPFLRMTMIEDVFSRPCDDIDLLVTDS
jgi:signal transduction histidine kinase